MTVIEAADIPTLSLLYKLNKLSAAPAGAKLPITLSGPSKIPTPSKPLNDRVGLFRGDITALAVDAIVNAANRSLLGGGGVDGAIHRAAGPGLLAECRRLNGCETGSAKITNAYELPCKKVIHAVGPIYDRRNSDISEMKLEGCYTASLKLAVQNGCKSIAFSGLSTGAYGYPSREAAPVALSAIRNFLSKDEGKTLEKVVIVTFEQKDVDAYNEFIPMYLPPVSEDASNKGTEESKETEAELDAEAEAVASELPSAPTSDPADITEHVEKKQKHDDA
ncbi:O-acetyl-ADP-ribose deacetylase MACROD1 [Diplogelasinospora grovesii]|uniref:O-acetyl-ADP-ribose deacetylase MACROD1 n=1 Tax=Diplogelasinospora grovesii TaxID=303347 RepID=A0AAN6MYJ6_9PEZI|nr:O-acetyl-ADP-ribose deacetylase MACROD1 [Diplogelasinospora grovesii]